MGYLVLARKWRPQTFNQVIGQDHVIKALQNSITYNRIGHAFLFAGARGTGKTSIARILAKALNCETGPTVTPCTRCSNCREITSGSAVDVYEIDGASNRGIDEIRELRENIKYLPAKCRFKIYIIDEVHMLTQEAFNALLKTLEEPPSHVIFMFATTEPHRIPVTILSRCQRYDLMRLSISDITDQLSLIAEQEKIALNDKALRFISRQAQGGMRDALSLLDRISSYDEADISEEKIGSILGLATHDEVLKLVRCILESDLAGALVITNRIYDYGCDIKQFYADILEAVRNIIVLRTCKESKAPADITEDEAAELEQMASGKDNETIYQYLNLLMHGWEEIRKSSSPKLALEMILIRLSLLKDIVPIEQVLEKISCLSAGMPDKELASEKIPVIRNAKENKPTTDKCAGRNDDFLDFVKAQSVPLSSILQQNQKLEYESGKMEIWFASSALCELLKGSYYFSRLCELARDYHGRDIKIDVLASAIPPAALKEKSNGQGWKEEILAHPLVQETMNIFGGHIEEVSCEVTDLDGTGETLGSRPDKS